MNPTDSNQPVPSNPDAAQRWSLSNNFGLHTVAIVLGVSVAGFVLGTHSQENPQRVIPPMRTADISDEVPSARSYRELSERPWGLKSDRISGLGTFTTTPDIQDLDRERIEQELHARALRRAYDGAPPIVPHAIDPRAGKDCSSCHEQGLRLTPAVHAPQLSHASYVLCIQCHATSHIEMPVNTKLVVDGTIQFGPNTFEGLAAPTSGTRAWPAAPPTMAHSVQMRGKCLSCHAAVAENPLRTSHPERVQCVQCHALSDQTPDVYTRLPIEPRREP